MSETRIQFGLVATVKSRRVVLPLKAVKCAFSVEGGVAEVTVTQVFLQENRESLDCLYQFPLPADASVYACGAFINDRVIHAKVEEREAARKLVKQKKTEGYRTVMVEEERENLFTLSLGNLQPEDLIEVRLAYIQPLRRLAGSPVIEIPFCPGVRYIPGRPLLRSNRGKGVVDDTDEVPDASRISPVRMDKSHPDAAMVEVEGTIEAGFMVPGSVLSPSHRISVQTENGRVRIALSDQAAVPDQNFVLRWQEQIAAAPTPRAWSQRKGNDQYALIEIRAPKMASEAATTPQDVYFLVDRSGSMEGVKWHKAVEALQNCVKIMAPHDRIMVTLFENSFQDFSEAPMPPAELLADEAFRQLAGCGATGGTDMGPALSHVLDLIPRHSAGRRTNLVLITDAQVGNERAILGIMQRAPGLAIHCFGIDNALNDALLQALTRQQGGSFHSLHPKDDIREAVTALGCTLRQPILLDIELSNGWETADHRIPDLYAGQVHYACARRTGSAELTLTARGPSGKPVTMKFDTADSHSDAPYLHWCKRRIQRLLAEDPQSKPAIELSKTANLICELTAFVAWDEKEKVAVAGRELVQPSLELETLGKVRFCLASPLSRRAPRMIMEDFDSLGLPETLADEADRLPKRGVEPWRKALLELGSRIRQPELRDQLTAIATSRVRFAEVDQPERLAALERLVEKLERLTTEHEHVLGALEIMRHKLERARREAETTVARALSAVNRLVHRLEADGPARDSRSDIEEALRADAGPGLSRLLELVKQIAELFSDRSRIEAEIADCLRDIASQCNEEPQKRTI